MSAAQDLVIDGDDTLWENNVYFERAIEEFIDFLAHSALTRHQVRAALDDIERLNAPIHGYGSASFAKNLSQCYRQLAERDPRPADLDNVIALGEGIVEQPMVLIGGVRETLADLARRHRLTLFTKGNQGEQTRKVRRSGLEGFFQRTVVVAEKDRGAFQRLVRDHSLAPQRSWMIGNSPRSDINPALAAGLNAVYIPHPSTWRLEEEPLTRADGRLLVLETFGDLRSHF